MKLVNGWIAACLVLGTPALAEEAKDAEEKQEPKRSVFMAAVAEKRDRGVKVWTNEDLERLGRGAYATTGDSDGNMASAQSLRWLQQQEREKASRSVRIAEAQAELDAAEAKLANLEKQLLATVNPFSARPQLSDEEKELRRTSGETALERRERTKQLADEARAEVQAARTKLDQARRGR